MLFSSDNHISLPITNAAQVHELTFFHQLLLKKVDSIPCINLNKNSLVLS